MRKKMSTWLVLVTILALVAMPLFSQGAADKKASEGTNVTELWYGEAMTEAGPPPEDWVGFQIIKDKLNIDLKITALPSSEGDQDVKIQAAAAANNLPDLFMVRREVLARLVPQGLVAPVDDLYAKMPVRTANHYDEVSRRNAMFNGKSYGLSDPGAIIKNEGLLIRKDWLDNLGLAVPTTIEELFTVMRAFTFNDPDRKGKERHLRLRQLSKKSKTMKLGPGAALSRSLELSVSMVRGT